MITPRIVIVLVNWNGKADTISCLASILRLNDDDVAVVVCDNDSHDGSVAAIMTWASENIPSRSCRQRVVGPADVVEDYLTIIPTGGNLGFAPANNIGIRLALNNPSVTHVWILNNDTEVRADSLSTLRERMAQAALMGICGSTLIYHHDRNRVQAIGVRYNLALGRGHQIGWGLPPDQLPSQAEVEKILTYVAGASMLVSRLFLETVGLMGEQYFLYFEELDWVLRNAGRFEIGWAPGSVVYHKEGGSIGTKTNMRASNMAIYYQSLNLLKIARIYRPIFLPILFLRMAALFLRHIVFWDWQGGATIWRAVCAFWKPDVPYRASV